jgi:thiol-disulfide isomerase/thioredoxin
MPHLKKVLFICAAVLPPLLFSACASTDQTDEVANHTVEASESVPASPPDTLRIELRQVRGFGPVRPSTGLTSKMDTTNSWFAARPEAIIPEEIQDKDYALMYFKTDFIQFAHQSMVAGKLDSSFVAGAFNSWGKNMADYSAEQLDVAVGILAWRENDTTKVMVKKRPPFDFTAAQVHVLPEPQGFLREEDMLLLPITHEVYYQGEVYELENWFRLGDIGEMGSQMGKAPGEAFLTGFYSHQRGEFELLGEDWTMLLHNDFGTGRYGGDADAIIVDKTENVEAKGDSLHYGEDESFGIGQFVKLDGHNYRIANVHFDGSEVTLVYEPDLEDASGTQKGLLAHQFEHETLSGDVISLEQQRGKYVLLDFWGSWCPPCVAEMPYLIEAYRLFRGDAFEIIGIANDQMEPLTSFIEEWEAEWPQIHQDGRGDTSIIELYNIMAYPTTFLLNPEGRIVDQNLRGFRLEKQLADALGFNEIRRERLMAGNMVLQLPHESIEKALNLAKSVRSVHIHSEEVPFSRRIPLYMPDGESDWIRGFDVEPGEYVFELFINEEPVVYDDTLHAALEAHLPGLHATEEDHAAFVLSVE